MRLNKASNRSIGQASAAGKNFQVTIVEVSRSIAGTNGSRRRDIAAVAELERHGHRHPKIFANPETLAACLSPRPTARS